jgi:hypothetical protein
VRLRWSSRGLARNVRVSIFRSSTPGVTVGAERVKTGLEATGRFTVAATKLRRGLNDFTLVATEGGVTFQRVPFPGTVRRLR